MLHPPDADAEVGERAGAGCGCTGEKGVGFVDGVDAKISSFDVEQCVR